MYFTFIYERLLPSKDAYKQVVGAAEREGNVCNKTPIKPRKITLCDIRETGQEISICKNYIYDHA